MNGIVYTKLIYTSCNKEVKTVRKAAIDFYKPSTNSFVVENYEKAKKKETDSITTLWKVLWDS